MAILKTQEHPDGRLGGYWREVNGPHAGYWAVDCTVGYRRGMDEVTRVRTTIFFNGGTVNEAMIETLVGAKAELWGAFEIIIHEVHPPVTDKKRRFIKELNEYFAKEREK